MSEEILHEHLRTCMKDNCGRCTRIRKDEILFQSFKQIEKEKKNKRIKSVEETVHGWLINNKFIWYYVKDNKWRIVGKSKNYYCRDLSHILDIMERPWQPKAQ